MDAYDGADINGLYLLNGRVGHGALGPLYRASRGTRRQVRPLDVFAEDFDRADVGDGSGRWVELVEPRLLQRGGGPAVVSQRLARCSIGPHHPSLVRSHESGTVSGGTAAGLFFIATDVRGDSLQALLEARQLAHHGEAEWRRFTREVARGLSVLHGRSLLHGLDPRNVYFDGHHWRLGPAISEQGIDAHEPSSDLRELGSLLKRLCGPDIPEVIGEVIRACLATDHLPAAAEVCAAIAGESPPNPVGDLTVQRREGMTAWLQWTPPKPGHVRLVRIRTEAGRKGLPTIANTVVLAEDLAELGELLPDEATPATVQVSPDKVSWVVPVTLLGEAGRVGRPVAISPVPDVGELQLTHGPQSLRVKWDWPDNIHNALLAWRRDGRPERPDDPRAMTKMYQRNGNYQRGAEIFDMTARYVAVYAAVPQGRNSWTYAAGVVEDAAHEANCLVQFHCATAWRGLSAWRVLYLKASRDIELPLMTLVERPDVYPTGPGDGAEATSVPAGTWCAANVETRIYFARNRRSGTWREWLFVVDAERYRHVILQHVGL